MKHLYLIRGVSGSGKTTFVNSIVQDTDRVICTDDFFIINGEYIFDPTQLKENHLKCQKKVGYWLSRGKTVFVHNTFTCEWEMTPYFTLSETFGYKVFTLIVENRHQGTSVHNVPDDVLESQKGRFEIIL
jgi:predicted ABC-type ATPase